MLSNVCTATNETLYSLSWLCQSSLRLLKIVYSNPKKKKNTSSHGEGSLDLAMAMAIWREMVYLFYNPNISHLLTVSYVLFLRWFLDLIYVRLHVYENGTALWVSVAGTTAVFVYNFQMFYAFLSIRLGFFCYTFFLTAFEILLISRRWNIYIYFLENFVCHVFTLYFIT